MGDGVRSRPRAARRQRRGFEGRGATQAAGDAGEDGGEVGGAEGFGEEGEARGGGALLDRAGELLAVVDQFADEAKDAAEAAGCVCVGPRWIGVRGCGGGLGGGGHELNENTKGGALSRKRFLQSCPQKSSRCAQRWPGSRLHGTCLKQPVDLHPWRQSHLAREFLPLGFVVEVVPQPAAQMW